MTTSPQVVAITATYRRPAELARLLRSLEKSTLLPAAFVVVDNADDPATFAAADASPLPHLLHAPGKNLGCGGGLTLAEQLALGRYPHLTHLWILDDDAVVFPETLAILLSALTEGDAEAAHPLTEDAHGRLSWFPGLLDRAKFRIIREPQTPAEFVRRCGSASIPFSWSQGIALLVTRRVLEELGPHRADYWVRGEDLEFTLRITARYRAIYVPTARVRHLPPASSGAAAAEYPKHLAMLQNLAYTGVRLPHGRRVARTLPGNCLRFLRTWSFTPGNIVRLLGALAKGALLGQPAGYEKP